MGIDFWSRQIDATEPCETELGSRVRMSKISVPSIDAYRGIYRCLYSRQTTSPFAALRVLLHASVAAGTLQGVSGPYIFYQFGQEGAELNQIINSLPNDKLS